MRVEWKGKRELESQGIQVGSRGTLVKRLGIQVRLQESLVELQGNLVAFQGKQVMLQGILVQEIQELGEGTVQGKLEIEPGSQIARNPNTLVVSIRTQQVP
jgi:hypothetical protein